MLIEIPQSLAAHIMAMWERNLKRILDRTFGMARLTDEKKPNGETGSFMALQKEASVNRNTVMMHGQRETLVSEARD